jgi:hypothetical protein
MRDGSVHHGARRDATRTTSSPAQTALHIHTIMTATRPAATVPSLDHFSYAAYERFYEPGEDTFLLLDGLEAEAGAGAFATSALCVELGWVTPPFPHTPSHARTHTSAHARTHPCTQLPLPSLLRFGHGG